jgi:hypothetical protein
VIAMHRRTASLLAAALSLAAAAAQAQGSAPAPGSNVRPEARQMCETVSMFPADALEMSRRAACVFYGILPSNDRLGESRALARAAVAKGETSAGLVLYLAYVSDPANRVLRDGKVDPEAYRRLASRTLAERKDQIEAIEALGLAAGRNDVGAAVLLAGYFHETVAPRNISRVGAMSALLQRMGEKNSAVERFGQEADAIVKAGQTNTSVRGFFETYQQAETVVRSTYETQSGGRRCEKPVLKTVSAGEIRNPQYLPLQGNMVKDSFLLKGQWTEYWTFDACGMELPLKVAFTADGAGGATSDVRFNKGD